MVRRAGIELLLVILVFLVLSSGCTKITKVSVVFLVQVCATFMCRLSVSIDNKGLTGDVQVVQVWKSELKSLESTLTADKMTPTPLDRGSCALRPYYLSTERREDTI